MPQSYVQTLYITHYFLMPITTMGAGLEAHPQLL